MYLKEKVIKFLKIKNYIFIFFAVFNIVASGSIIISLVSHYSDRLEVLLYAKAMPDCIKSIILGIILLIIAYTSKRMIGDAGFYSSYFEGSLDEFVKCSDLAEVTGKKEYTIKNQLKFFRIAYMKNYELKIIDNTEQVCLSSKKCICECRNCGAEIEKSMFYGECPYCKSSNLFAKVLTDNKFYSIENEISDAIKKPDYYSANLSKRKILFTILYSLGCSVLIISIIAVFDNIAKYNDKEYLTEVLLSGESYSSFELIKKEIMDVIIDFSAIVIAFIPIVINRTKRLRLLFTTDKYARYFSGFATPFIEIEKFPYKKGAVKNIRILIRYRYLRNCTIEKHSGILKIALAKKIVKDKCPSCGGPIIGAVDEHYKCKYCGNTIMDVLSKK